MGKGLTFGTIIGSVIVFVWMMLSWSALPWHCNTMNEFKDESAVVSVLMENIEEDGVYMIPSWCEKDKESVMQQMKQGPLVFSAVKKGGQETGISNLIFGLFTQVIGAFIITFLLLQTHGLGYWRRVWFVSLIGLVIGVLSGLPEWNWMYFPFSYVGLGIVDLFVGWFLAGLGIAAVAHPSKKK